MLLNLYMFTKTLVATLLFAVFVPLVHADDIAEDLSSLGFVETTPLMRRSKAHNAANNSIPAHYVETTDTLIVRKPTRHELYPDQLVFDAGSFNYVGIDRGEFGGGLYVGSPESGRRIFEGNVKFLVPLGDDLYIISGIAHMMTNQGAIHVIRNYREPSAPVQVTLLPNAPMAMTLGKSWDEKTSFVIAGFSSLMVFVADDELEILAYDTFWSGLYPSSIVEFKGNYVIGIRSGLAVIRTKGYSAEVRYFVPK
jgi:hypothetical protein